jgi:hypothetical protein
MTPLSDSADAAGLKAGGDERKGRGVNRRDGLRRSIGGVSAEWTQRGIDQIVDDKFLKLLRRLKAGISRWRGR